MSRNMILRKAMANVRKIRHRIKRGNDTGISLLVLGIVSCYFRTCSGSSGIVLGTVSLVRVRRKEMICQEQPWQKGRKSLKYRGNMYSRCKRILAIVPYMMATLA